MGEHTYNFLLGLSWERIEALGYGHEMRGAIWAHFHPVLHGLLSAAVINGMAMLECNARFLRLGR